MKKLIASLILGFVLQTGSSFGKLSAYYSYAVFDQPGKSPYIETYLSVVSPSVTLVPNAQGKFQGTLEVQWIFTKAGKIIHFDKYNLHSPEADSLKQSLPDFIDQQRISLDTGMFELELKLSDKNSTEPAFSTKQNILINFPPQHISISDIELLESYTPTNTPGKFTKSGYDLVPYILGYYPKEISALKFYSEIYRSKSTLNEDYLIRYFISNSNNKQLLNDFAGTRKQSASDINVLLAEIPITNLPTGNYNLTVEVLSRSNKLIAYKSVFFQRSNTEIKAINADEVEMVDVNNTFIASMTNVDTLIDFIACLYPISTGLETQIGENQIRLADVHSMQQYIYYFWSKRDAQNPAQAWMNYYGEVLKVNASYTTRNKKGYETDRGRVYLQYGPPNSISNDALDPDAYPYEIWHYYSLNNQSNRKFVFYATELSSNEYELLHSDAKGELQDPAWELKLHSRSQRVRSIDDQNSDDIYGSKTKENFKLPK